MSTETKNNLLSPELWLRFVFMLVVALFVQVATALMWVLVIVQFVFKAFSGSVNQNLFVFSASLSRYIFQCWQFLTFETDAKPYPFQDWPIFGKDDSE